MREFVAGRANRGVWTTPLLILAAWLLAFATPALALSSPASGSEASPAGVSSASVPALTADLSKTSIEYGAAVTVAGTLTPAVGGEQVIVKLGDASVGAAEVDASGDYALTFTPRVGGDVVASLASDPAVASDPVALSVRPGAKVTHGKLVPFLSSKVVVKITPAAYDGLVVVRLTHKGAAALTYRARARNGKATLRIPLRGVDRFNLRVTLPAAAGLDGRTLQARVSVRAKKLSVGSSGSYVKGMLTALRRLKFRVPNVGTRFTTQVKDSVMAFQKAYRLSRTYVFNTACWRKIDGAKIIRARHAKPATHLEVDKRRQIAMVVKGGKPYGIICVSTGATGNTPEGTFHIQQKHSFTTSGFGGVLVRTMGFVGNFAMHGYTPVPPYPASHGCVREPIWASYWMYDRSWVGETLYIYH
jgi:lipoprotein-anchoring transpeptidase ErfK/SrfK